MCPDWKKCFYFDIQEQRWHLDDFFYRIFDCKEDFGCIFDHSRRFLIKKYARAKAISEPFCGRMERQHFIKNPKKLSEMHPKSDQRFEKIVSSECHLISRYCVLKCCTMSWMHLNKRKSVLLRKLLYFYQCLHKNVSYALVPFKKFKLETNYV